MVSFYNNYNNNKKDNFVECFNGVIGFRRTDDDYLRRAGELAEMIETLSFMRDGLVLSDNSDFSYNGRITIDAETIHHHLLEQYNRLTGEHLTF